MRLELKPLNVKVLTVVTGAIETSIHVNAPGVKLPEKSFYRAVQNRLNALKTDEVKVKRTEAHVYAEKVVNDVLGGASGKTFRGSYSSIAKYATMYLPTFVTVCNVYVMLCCGGIGFRLTYIYLPGLAFDSSIGSG